MTKCRFAKSKHAAAATNLGAVCNLKLENPDKQKQVHEALVRIGLEKTRLIGSACPVAMRSTWHKCPFYEPLKDEASPS